MAKILIAEDDPTAARILTRVVERMGHWGFVSPHGRHAWEALLANPDIDLLVTDVMMPEMDGRQLVRVCRGHTQVSTMPIIIMSAVVTPREISDLLDLGVTWFMAKPLDVKLVREAIDRCLEPSQVSAGRPA